MSTSIGNFKVDIETKKTMSLFKTSNVCQKLKCFMTQTHDEQEMILAL